MGDALDAVVCQDAENEMRGQRGAIACAWLVGMGCVAVDVRFWVYAADE